MFKRIALERIEVNNFEDLLKHSPEYHEASALLQKYKYRRVEERKSQHRSDYDIQSSWNRSDGPSIWLQTSHGVWDRRYDRGPNVVWTTINQGADSKKYHSVSELESFLQEAFPPKQPKKWPWSKK